MRKFDHFELDPNNNRILACGIDKHEQAQKTPIFRLSSIATDEHRVIVCDDDKPMFVFEASGKDEVLKKYEELTSFINRHFKISPSCFMP